MYIFPYNFNINVDEGPETKVSLKFIATEFGLLPPNE